MSASFRLAVGQAPGELPTTDARLDWLASQLPTIRDRRADLLVLPELFATGYNIAELCWQRGEPADGPIAQAMTQLAQKFGMALHYGYPERVGDQLFNSTQCIDPTGRVLGRHRKLALPPGFEVDVFAPGAGCQLFDYRDMRIATLICYEAEFVETVRHVAGLGATLVLVPTALNDQWPWVARTMIPSRGYENGVYLAYANSAGTERGLTYLGESFVGAPNGTELVRAGADPTILYADLARDQVTAAQTRLPYLADRHHLSLS